MKIYPSLISADLLNLQQTIELLDDHCDGYHLDVMDDHFVPNLTWGPAFINAIAQVTKKPLQVHLMVDNPGSWIKRLKLTSNDSFLFHIEAIHDQEEIETLIQRVQSNGIRVGIAINPKTEQNRLAPYLEWLDEVLVMSVEPGFSGQQFIPEVLDKARALHVLKEKNNYTFQLFMDGGINEGNIAQVAGCGVGGIGVASAIFSQPDPIVAIQYLRKNSV